MIYGARSRTEPGNSGFADSTQTLSWSIFGTRLPHIYMQKAHVISRAELTEA